MKLNGWLRLWILASAILLVAFSGIGAYFYIPLVQPEGTKDIKVKGSGQVILVPEEMKHEEIIEFIREFQPLGEKELEKQAQINRLAVNFRVMKENEVIKDANKKFQSKLFMAWLICVTSMLFLGLGIAWVKNGFENT